MASGTTEMAAKDESRSDLTQWEKFAEKDWTRFTKDVLVQPSVGPMAGWLISVLIGLVAWLTWTYAPDAAGRASVPHGSTPDGVIPVTAGYFTIVAVSILALFIGWEPIVARRLGAGRGIGFGSWLSRQPRFLRIPILIIAWPVGWSLWIIWRTPSFVLSVIDWMLVRIVAVIAGTTLRPFPVRYAVLFLWLGVSIYFAWTGPYGILAAFAGVVVVLSVVRRWSWIESDREAFLTMREYDHQTKRVGFGEDLRDEALTAIVFVFILIPLALRQTDLVYGAFYHADGTPIVLDWIGFFGAELAKSVPFVDWSEVFHVANGSPIKPKTPLGAQLVFALRAALDLLLLAAILQAVQIAARLREQDKAFWAGKLPIVDPFAERAYFSRVEKSRVTHPHVPAAKQPAAIGFPEYQERRLCQIVEGEALSASSAVEAPVLRDSVARQGAMTILARQSPDEKTARLIAAQSVNPASGNDLSAFCVQLAVESAPDHAGAILAPLLAEAEAPAIRAQIARELGRLEVAEAFDALSQRLFASDEDITVRAAAAVALSKLSRAEGDPSDILSKIDELAIHLQADTPDIVLMLSYARAGWPPQQEDAQQTVSVFPDKLRPLALRAARSRLEQLDQMVEISAGHYMMGAAEGETGALARKYPQHEVKIAAFEMGKYAVTFEEYDAFCEATDREKPSDQGWGRNRRPVINVSWRDAHAYCDWLYTFTGELFRLPSEAEWEYACRAGTTTPYYTGETITKSQAQFSEDRFGSAEQTVDVGTFKANDFGLHDMHGNVWEWCADPWHGNYTGAPKDGSVWLKDGSSGLRVARGGSWNYIPQFLRSAFRNRDIADVRINDIGFRLSRTLNHRS